VKGWALVASLLVLGTAVWASEMTAAEYAEYEPWWSWGVGQIAVQWEAPVLTSGSQFRGEASLVHLENHASRSWLWSEIDLINFSGLVHPSDGGYAWEGTLTWPRVTLWLAVPWQALPLLEVGPYASATGLRGEAGLRLRLSAKLSEPLGYRPFVTLSSGLNTEGRWVTGASVELAALVVVALWASNRP